MNQAKSSASLTSTTAAQLAVLTGRSKAFFYRHRDELPPTTPIPSERGRPELAYDLADLAQFVQQHTAHLSDAECRLLVALSMIGKGDGKKKRIPLGSWLLPLADGGAQIMPPCAPGSR